ncbi:nuclear GTPase SLIP-GC-like isoform X2 [Carcharodon carcharias]|uniref:nuclear GTPase SLIP-GC-like isoform X2 n=1 Tax=Carcharodon carcharias TaxID=13397 RepID=UPI001B7F39C5|nr:nuclear GTPase SLIP-GC-like isoform X2 [Carcharodon carcharias]
MDSSWIQPNSPVIHFNPRVQIQTLNPQCKIRFQIETMELADSERATSNSPGAKRKMTPEPSGRKRYRGRYINNPSITTEDQQLWENCNKWEGETKKVVEAVLEKLEQVSPNGSDEEELLFALKKKTQQLKEKCLLENIYIGVFGQTGAGKSSLVNAVLEEESLLPTSSTGACTSAITKVQSGRGRKFKAEIEFLKEKEWNEELKVLVELCEKDDDSDDDDEDNKEVEMAKNKLKTIYGDYGPEKNYEDLIKMNIYQDIPKSGKKILSEENAEELSKKLDPYIRSKANQTNKIYWPFVKSVSVYIPNSQILPEGIALIDFPGSGDSNKARDEMWRENLINCSSVWIVSAISRALDEKLADEIFGTSIKSATNGGRCHDIAFICTKTDDIQWKEYAREHAFTEEEMNVPMKGHIIEPSEKKKQFCMLHRNDTVKAKMMKQCEVKWKRLMKNKSAQLEFSKDDLSVYTVSSRKYWDSVDGESSGVVSETEIPSLKKHIINMYLKERKKVVNDYVSEVWGMLHLLGSLNSNQNKQNIILSSRFDTMSKDLKKGLEAFAEHLECCGRDLQGHLKSGVEEAEKRCMKVIKQHAELPGAKSYQGYHKTLKAICRNDGVYNSARFGPINVNFDLSKSLYREIDTFSENNLQLNRGRRASMKGQLNRINLTLTNVIDQPLPTKSTDDARVWECRQNFMKTELNGLLNDLERQIIERKQHIYKAAILSVQSSMKPAYEEACQKKGVGVVPSMQRILTERLEKQNDLFKDAAASVMEKFNEMKDHLKEEMKNRMTITLKLGFSQWPGCNPLPDFENDLNQINPIWNEVKKN